MIGTKIKARSKIGNTRPPLFIALTLPSTTGDYNTQRSIKEHHLAA
ncbi:hypothetical protein A6A12_2454 [Vibrio anguillarum]|nr:hypothetical protein A6A12_2454 [Vibrio anguillarum]